MSIWLDVFYKPILNLLLALYDFVPGQNLGVAIILLTFLIRFLVLPLGLRAGRAQRKLRRVQPQLNALRETHKADPQALARAQMDFYRQYKVSPWASCLPVILQFPVLIALFQVLNEGLREIDPSHVYGFVMLPEKLNSMFLGVDLSVPDPFVVPIIAAGTQYILMKLTNPDPVPEAKKKEPDGTGDGEKKAPQMEQLVTNQMALILPVITFVFARGFPAGLALYWVASTVFGIAQQMYVNREKVREVTIRIRHEKGGEDVITMEQ